MLYVANNGETCRDQLCQHPECWQSNVRRVREAVRKRNNILQEDDVSNPSSERFDDMRQHLKDNQSYSLPTLKIIDMSKDLITPNNSGNQGQIFGNQAEQEKQHMLNCAVHQLTRPACQSSLRAQAPHTTPISPSLPEKHISTDWKEILNDNMDLADNPTDETMAKINFHEIYDYNEVCQGWQDMFISTAYLVWCPAKRKRRKKVTRASSAVSEKRKGFKNPIEDMLPLPTEDRKKKPQTSSKVPTGGQPYSPCRSPVSRMYNVKPVDYMSEGEYIMTLTKEDIPKSLIATKKIIEQKQNTARKEKDVDFGLKKSGSTKVLVDISATLATPGEDKNTKVEEKNTVELFQRPKDKRQKKRTGRIVVEPTSDLEYRKMLPLPSIAIPWGLIPEKQRDHCRNSIPHCVDLDVMMEPVLYLPKTASESRTRVCADMSKKEAWRETTGPSWEAEERNHLTSAYRVSPKKIDTPAPTPATPGSRDIRRHRSGRRLPYTKDSLSNTRLREVYETEKNTKVPLVRSSGIQIEQSLQEVAEINEGTIMNIGNEFSKMSFGQNQTNSTQSNIEVQSPGLDKVSDRESGMSDRAVSPSSRTNIPSDIWAELRSGGAFDHRRITSRSNLDVRNSDRPRSLLRGYHSSLGLSIYSYTGESSWKPHPPRLPKSFTYMGVYKPTILPKMPASLTVVPVPSVTRPGHVTETPRKMNVELGKICSIRIPPVPTPSPVPNIDIVTATASNADGASSSTETLITVENKSLESLNQKQGSVDQVCIREQILEEKEYIISREIISETEEEIPLDSMPNKDSTALTVAEETLQDMVNSDKYTIEDTLRLLDSLAGETEEFMNTLPNAVSTKSVTSTKDEATDVVMEEKQSKLSSDDITCTNYEITCTKDEITCTKDEAVGTEAQMLDSTNGASGSKREINHCAEDKRKSSKDKTSLEIVETRHSKDDTAHHSEATCTEDVTVSPLEDNTCRKSEENVITPNTVVTVEMCQNDEINEERSEKSPIMEAQEHPKSSENLSAVSAQRSVHKSGSIREIQGSHRSLLFPGDDVRSILDTSDIPKVPSNFELMPFNVESDLLSPIKIDSDLLLFTDDDDLMNLEDKDSSSEGLS
ncbi:uncharacterized protein LOC114519074 isoform X2 [Dendronephthya gigantea]|uniref:uncharacterized protein LOC114519074 isoform X2 n=1 Tax=Dendronephthya gigantea TaxID=151771 RepID=UPI00106A7E34|nr:uncharacterized protein LOC114519074 isoform X2 [Dendronephthya gigantea]